MITETESRTPELRVRAIKPEPETPPTQKSHRFLTHWATSTAIVVLLIAGSIVLRTRGIAGGFWMDEGLSVGIASHPFTEIPGLLRQDGSPPLYYLLLNLWMQGFGASEVATHWLSLVFALLTIPTGLWAGWSLFGRRAGWIVAVLCTVNPFLTFYAQETRMYSLAVLLGLVTAASFLHVFVYRRRAYLPVFVLFLALMLYTHNWSLFFGVGTFLALIPCLRATENRRGFLIDAAIAFGSVAILYLPWLPTVLFQSAHTGAPWTQPPRAGAPIQVTRAFGGSNVACALILGMAIGISMVRTRVRATGKPSRGLRAVTSLTIIFGVTLAIAWVLSQITPAWNIRYFGVIIAPVTLIVAFGISRGGRFAMLAFLAAAALSLNPQAYSLKNKSNTRDVSGYVQHDLRPGDLLISTQPEQLPMLHYYLPGPYAYATTLGAVKDPKVMDWRDGLKRLRAAQPRDNLAPLLDKLQVGGHVFVMRPMTTGVQNWSAPWTSLVRRRSAQWGQALAEDQRFQINRVVPDFYSYSSVVGVSGVLYTKVRS